MAITEQLVQRRKGRCMAQSLDEFEREVEPHLPEEVATNFKAFVRRKLNSFATDLIEALQMGTGMVENAAARDIRDRLQPG